MATASAPLGFLPLHAAPGDEIPPLEGWTYFTAWVFEPIVFSLILLSAALYLYGVWILRRRGDKWPISRTIYFVVLGLGSLSIAVFSFLGVYDTVLFWTHMIQHMLMNMIAPVFLVAGAPVTLALRTLPKGPRSWLLAFLHSFPAKVLLFPPLTTLLMIGSPFLLYLTNWYDATLRSNLLHDSLHIWFVIVGFLFFFPLLGVDPVPIKLPYPIRILLFFLTMPFHAFLGVIIMGSSKLIAEDWYLSFGRTWGPSPLQDQTLAGGLMWATGDLTMIAAMSTIFAQWIRESSREARRVDRALDREAELAHKRASVASAAAERYDAAEPETVAAATETKDGNGNE